MKNDFYKWLSPEERLKKMSFAEVLKIGMSDDIKKKIKD
jgi:hypothetical protein